MEKILEGKVGNEKGGLHPAFVQCLPVFILPFGMFLLLPFGAKQIYLDIFFAWLEAFFLALVQLYRATTHYILWPDRIEVRTGVLGKRSKSIPFGEITEINCKQSLYQRVFGIGDVFIETAGGAEFTLALAGVEYPRRLAQFLFEMKERGRG